MTVDRSHPRAKPRWLALSALVLGLTAAVGVGLASAAIPGGYSVVVDEHGANDVPGQVDVTQMGVMASESPDLRIFWSWDSTSAWTGSGQTGDACALFDTIGASGDADAFVNYVVCARVQNLNANPGFVQILPSATNKPVYIFNCSNKKFDRCTNPSPGTYTAGQVLAGPFNTLSQSGVGNLINDSDPFNASALNGPGESYPNDSSIDIRIDRLLVPAGVKMVNVCSYPSAGNGGNNNPFDCIRTPGAGTLIVNKTLNNDNGGTRLVTSFNFTVGSGASTTGVLASTAFEADASNSVSVTEGTYSVAEVGTPIAGYTTTYSNCTSVTVVAGGTATCTITNNDNAPSLTLVKTITNDNGGGAAVGDWTLRANKNGTDTTTYELTGTTPVASGTGFAAGTYDLSETGGPSGYTASAWSCVKNGGAAVEGSSIAIALGDTATCTINNNDNEPSLTLVKTITNDNGGGAAVGDWTLRADKSPVDGTYELSGTTPVASGTGFAAGTYNLSETGPGGYTPSAWSCVKNGGAPVNGSSIVIALGDTATCTINNNDDIATPDIDTTMSWTLHDAAALTGFVSDGGVSTVTFTLYLDTATETDCDPDSEVIHETVNVNDATGTATTTTGFLVTEPGTYRWIASFSGNDNNAPIDSDCGDEVTVITE